MAQDGRLVSNDIIFTVENLSTKECIKRCIIHKDCKSINHEKSLLICEGLRETSKDYIITTQQNWTHYETDYDESQVGEICSTTSPCPDHYCEDICESPGFNCTCRKYFTGERCTDYIGPGRKTDPITSCKQLKDEYPDFIEDKYYWMKGGTNDDFEVYCDMNTVGGGWTMIGFANVSVEEEADQYDYLQISTENITELPFVRNGRMLLNGDGLNTLHQLINFTQLRIRCYKPWHGRTFHITTTKNESGFEVVKAMYNDVYEYKKLDHCSSFEVVSDDTSILARKCTEWVPIGIWDNTFALNRRLYDHIVYTTNGGHVQLLPYGRIECDDFVTTFGGKKGTWEYFVR